MKIFLDTADHWAIEDYYNTGLIDGVTTNPTLIKQSGRDPEDVYQHITLKPPIPIALLDHPKEYRATHLGKIPEEWRLRWVFLFPRIRICPFSNGLLRAIIC